MRTSEKLTKAFSDAIPLGPHAEPHAEWIQIRLDFVQQAIGYIAEVETALLELTAAIEYVDKVRTCKEVGVSYETMQRSGFKRKDGWRRKYGLADARSHAETAAIRLRNAWEILDPSELKKS